MKKGVAKQRKSPSLPGKGRKALFRGTTQIALIIEPAS